MAELLDELPGFELAMQRGFESPLGAFECTIRHEQRACVALISLDCSRGVADGVEQVGGRRESRALGLALRPAVGGGLLLREFAAMHRVGALALALLLAIRLVRFALRRSRGAVVELHVRHRRVRALLNCDTLTSIIAGVLSSAVV